MVGISGTGLATVDLWVMDVRMSRKEDKREQERQYHPDYSRQDMSCCPNSYAGPYGAAAHFPNTVQDNDVFKQSSRGRKRKNPSGLSKISSGMQDFVERYLLKFSNRKRSRRSFLSRSHAIEVHSPACLLRKFSYILLKERAALAADRIRVKYGVLCQPSHVKIGNGITVYGDKEILGKLIKVTHAYPTLWEDDGNLVDIPEHQWMDIPLIEGWENIYQAGQVRAYPVGHQDQEFINKEFDKLHQQGRIE